MNLLQRNAMERSMRFNTSDYKRIHRTIHIDADIMMLRGILEKQRHIKAVGTLGPILILLI